MKIFCTGASGYIGGSVAAHLVTAGHQVTGLVRSQDKADAAGKSGEMSHQMALAGKALKRDMETILLSAHAQARGQPVDRT